MKMIKTKDAQGQVLCHDITQIIKGITGYFIILTPLPNRLSINTNI
jgi:hypothetical protein